MMGWTYRGQPFDPELIEDHVGFVYVIKDLLNDKRYIGQKLFHFKRTLAPLKGKSRNRIKKVESDWRTYHGSNDELNARVMEFGPDHFKRTILYLCKSKAEMNYFELYEQMNANVLLRPDRFYNSYVGGRISRGQLRSLVA